MQPLNRTGNFFNGGIYKNDNKCAELEIALIEKVFEKLRTKVCFKSYPHQSYADTDPVLERIMQANNVDLIEPNKDSIPLDEVEIVITVGISSTLGWCLFSGKPVVYVDPVMTPIE